jgi:hypothetical protein
MQTRTLVPSQLRLSRHLPVPCARAPVPEFAARSPDQGALQQVQRRTKLLRFLQPPLDRGLPRRYSVLSSPLPFHIERRGNAIRSIGPDSQRLCKGVVV